jgi:hypothetical protein
VAGKHVPFLSALTDCFHTEIMAVPFALTFDVQVAGVILAVLLVGIQLICAGCILTVWAATHVVSYGLLRHYHAGVNVHTTEDVFQRLSVLSKKVKERTETPENHTEYGKSSVESHNAGKT